MFSLRRFIAPSAASFIQQQACIKTTVAAFTPFVLQPARFCATSAASSSSTQQASSTSSSSSSTNSNNRSGNFRRDNNNNNRRSNSNTNSSNNSSSNTMTRRGGNYSQQQHTESRTIGVVEFYDVRDFSKEGRELRLAFRQDTTTTRGSGGRGGSNSNNNPSYDEVFRTMSITIRPQLGPRKTDPHDPAPQFDQANRLTLRLKPKEVATLLFWLQGRQGADVKSVEVSGNSYKISLARQDNGVVLVTLSGTKLDGTPSEPLGYELQPHQQIQFTAFLENSLYAFWGLPAF